MTIHWKPIGTAPHDATQVWAIDDERTIYRVRWFERDGVFVDQMSDDAIDLTHWCDIDEIPLPEI